MVMNWLINNLIPIIMSDMVITVFWAIFVFIEYRYDSTISEKFAKTIFWPINVLLWLFISVPKFFINDAIRRLGD